MSNLYDDILNPWGPTPSTSSQNVAASGGTGMLGSDPLRDCLNKVVLPPVYTIAYSSTLKHGGGKITRSVLQRALVFSGLPRQTVGQIVLAADTGAPEISQKDFNLSLAMVALAQKNISPTIEGVMFHKDDLPVPVMKGIESLATEDDDDDDGDGDKEGSKGPGNNSKYPGNSNDDPWSNAATPRNSTPQPTQQQPQSQAPVSQMASMSVAAGAGAGAGATNSKQQAESSSGNQQHVPKINMDAAQWKLNQEDITIKEAAEKGGIVFKHINYEVSTRSFTAMVVRRYNDFFWLSNYLVKRYPYRMHPNIPPKGFPVDRQFLDNRIKGLTRFSNAILRIPFLRRDALIIQFFSNTDEFSRVIKVGNLDMDAEEFDPQEEMDGAPASDIRETYEAFDQFYGQVAKDEEKYRIQITALEKVARYKQAMGDELYSYSDTLRLVNMPADGSRRSNKFHVLSKAKRALRNGLNELSMSFGDASLLEKSEGEVVKTISAEYLRRLYDVVISMKLMMDRMRLNDKQKDIQRVKERRETNTQSLAQAGGGSSSGNGANRNGSIDLLTGGGRSSSPAGRGSVSSGYHMSVDRAAIEKFERLIKEDNDELEKLGLEQRRIELRFYQELARYKCYEVFLQTHYHKFVEEQIKHHTLALNAWKQALVTADDLPTKPIDFITPT